jgi:hypothetical protein
MTGVYQFLLKFYPAADRSAFCDEMLEVFRCAESDAARLGPIARAWFYLREWADLLAGAGREQLHALGEERGWKFLAERGPMFQRERRYPYSSIIFMSMTLGLIVLVIAKAQGIAHYVVQMYTINGQLVVQTRPGVVVNHELMYWPSHWALLGSIGLFFAITWLAAVAAWGIAHAMRRTGVHRLDDAQTWPQTR